MTKTIILTLLIAGVFIAGSLVTTEAYAAVDMFLKFDGVDGEAVDGESQKAGHEDEIDVLAWSWGISQSGSASKGGGGGSGKVQVQDLSITKFVDSSTVPLLKSCCGGNSIDTLELRFFDSARSPVEPYMIYKLKDVIMTSYSTGGSGGEDRLTENVSLNFEEIKVTYKKLDSSQPNDGDSVTIKKHKRG